VPLSRDFILWLYRDRYKLTWRGLEAQPAWRTERDLAYLQLEAQAEAYHAQQRAKVQQDQEFEDFKGRARKQLGLVK
jgi:hypothetical protein